MEASGTKGRMVLVLLLVDAVVVLFAIWLPYVQILDHFEERS